MRNTFKKISALVLVAVMMLTLSAVAFAVDGDMTGMDGVVGAFEDPDTPKTFDNPTVKIYKEITAYNPEECTVNAPTITYNYSIAAGSAGKDIIDANSHHDPAANAQVKTKAGIGTPTITGTSNGVLALTPATHTLEASENGTANRFELTVSFAGIQFNPDPIPSGHTLAEYGAGVYRYVISETTTQATKNAAGIKEGDVANTLYMDVYVDGNGAIYGYVLFTNDVNIDASPNNDAGAATAAGKTEGFVGPEPDGGKYANEADSTADKYYTFNLKIEKQVVGDDYIASVKHQFPFTVTLENTSVTAAVLPIMSTTNAAQTALTAAAITGTWNPTIADDGYVEYVGIPCGTTVTINETNNVAGTKYKSASTGADTDAASKDLYTNDVSNNAIVDCGATALAVATENHDVTFTNTLIQISPTGVVMRIAPYAAILGAGVLLFAVSRRYNKRREDEVAEAVEA